MPRGKISQPRHFEAVFHFLRMVFQNTKFMSDLVNKKYTLLPALSLVGCLGLIYYLVWFLLIYIFPTKLF